MSRPEKLIRGQIERVIGSMSCVLLLSNPSGRAEFVRLKQGQGEPIGGVSDASATSAPIDYGLGGRGGPDLIGLLHVRHISSLMSFTIMFGIEVKAEGKHRSKEQIRWHLRAQSRGMWILEEATSAVQAKTWLDARIAALAAVGLEVIAPDEGRLAALRALR